MSVFDQIRQQIRNAKTIYDENFIQTLSSEGERICKLAASTKDTRNRSDNQMDAYGYAVYLNGKMKAKGYAGTEKSDTIHHGWAKHNIEPNTGRGYLDSFFAEYVPPVAGYHLIVVNAVYYSQILEDGMQPGVKYRIISQVGDEIYELAQKYNGTVKIISPIGRFG